VSGAQDGSVRVWDLEAWGCLRILQGHRGWVGAVALAPDGRTAVSAGRDATLRVWDVRSGKCVQTLTGHADEVLDVALAPELGLALSASADSTVRVWALASGKCLAVYQAGAEVCAVSPLWPGGRFACGTEDGQMHSLTLRNLL
jgi:WD40 repeat protein